MFKSFPDAQARQRISVGLHKVFDCSLVSSRVVPQSPANGFANEELLFMGPFQTELEQPVSIRLLLLAKLE